MDDLSTLRGLSISPLQLQEKIDKLMRQLDDEKSLRRNELASYEAHKGEWQASEKVSLPLCLPHERQASLQYPHTPDMKPPHPWSFTIGHPIALVILTHSFPHGAQPPPIGLVPWPASL